jgi:hypothetical protein
MNATMILTSGDHVAVRLVEKLTTITLPDLSPAIYQLPGGRYVVGYTEDGQVYQDPDSTPDDYQWSDDEEAV